MKGFHEIQLQDEDQGEILLLVALPTAASPWGVLAPLIGTPWGAEIQIIKGDVLSIALHGYATPLVRALGSEPRGRARRVSKVTRCAQFSACPTAAKGCIPGEQMPGCYEAPNLSGDAQDAALVVARAWKEGRYVVVVDGPEFSF